MFEQAVEHLQQQLRLAKQLADEQNSIQEQIYAQFWLGRCYLEQAIKAEGKDHSHSHQAQSLPLDQCRDIHS